MANRIGKERDLVSQTLTEGKCWHMRFSISDYLSLILTVGVPVTRATCRLFCQLQVDNWGLGSVPSQDAATTVAC